MLLLGWDSQVGTDSLRLERANTMAGAVSAYERIKGQISRRHSFGVVRGELRLHLCRGGCRAR